MKHSKSQRTCQISVPTCSHLQPKLRDLKGSRAIHKNVHSKQCKRKQDKTKGKIMQHIKAQAYSEIRAKDAP